MAVILLAGASAFVKSNIDSPAAVYHWYYVDAAGSVNVGSEAFGGQLKDQAYANAHPPCATGLNADCIRGFESIPSLPTMATGEATPLRKP
ncbi:MAG: hypothetical protein ABI594_14760 [Ginsengibacter sp.]